LNSRCKSFFAVRRIFSRARTAMVTRVLAARRRAVFLCSTTKPTRDRASAGLAMPHVWRLRRFWLTVPLPLRGAESAAGQDLL
jgi:hypothetical protein